jgi:hypothetical protein
MSLGRGLTEVPDLDLKRLLRLVFRQEIRFPLDLPELARCGLQHCAADLMAQLRGLPAPAVQAVLVNVMAERQALTRLGSVGPRSRAK